MKKFVAKTIEEALQNASQYFQCSIIQVEYEVIKNPSNGFFGFMKKEAVIVAAKKEDSSHIGSGSQTNFCDNSPKNLMQDSTKNATQTLSKADTQIKKDCMQSDKSQISNTLNTHEIDSYSTPDTQTNFHDATLSTHNNTIDNSNIHVIGKECPQTNQANNVKLHSNLDSTRDSQENISHTKISNEIDNNMYDDTTTSSQIPWQDLQHSTTQYQNFNVEQICQEVQSELVALLKLLPFDLNKVQVSLYDNHTLSILIDGLDAALLIGQKGYRYKSLSYLLFNWIHTRYGYGVRLEIAQFLRNQEEIMRVYLQPIIESAKLNGKAQTKPLDGILTHIALKILREELPNKYIVFKETTNGEKYITISDFLGNTNHRTTHGFGDLPKY